MLTMFRKNKFTVGQLEFSYSFIGLIIVILASLLAIVRVNYLLFHTFVEIFSILVSFTIFIVFWNRLGARDSLNLNIIGISSLFTGFIDLFHTLTYSGMNVIPGYDTNTPTQFWILARIIQSLSFLLAFCLRDKKGNHYVVFLIYLIITFLGSLLIFIRLFPDCYVMGQGLTPFKKISEYIICIVYLASTMVLYFTRKEYSPKVYQGFFAVLIISIMEELSFTFYFDVFTDIFIITGHFLKFIAVIFLYLSIVETSITQPHFILYRDLQNRTQELEQALNEVKSLKNLLPICASCKKIRNDEGYWEQVDEYFHEHQNIEFTHGLCPDCAKKLYPEFFNGENKPGNEEKRD